MPNPYLNIRPVDPEILTWKSPSDFFRMLIVGASQSGKTKMLLDLWESVLSDQYHEIYVFTIEDNKEFYRVNFGTKHVYTNEQTCILDIESIIAAQRKPSNILRYDQDKKPVYKKRILIVFDDIISESLVKTPTISQLFGAGRHSYISTVFIIQHPKSVVSTFMKGQITHLLMFKTVTPSAREWCVEMLAYAGRSKVENKDIMREAKRLYDDVVLDIKYGYIGLLPEKGIAFLWGEPEEVKKIYGSRVNPYGDSN